MKALFFLGFLVIASRVFTQLIPIPAPFNAYYHSGNNFSSHHEVVRFFECLQQQYPQKIKLETYGYTEEGRPLTVAFLGSEKNIKSLENLRKAHVSRQKEETVLFIWFSYNVHGNESCGTEAAMETAYRLMTVDSLLLENSIIILDPCLNPDGRDRYVSYYKQYKNKTQQVHYQSAEHDETWPGGRPNHYLFDLNRDWAWLSQVESQNRVKIYNRWLPHLHVDFHEQGMNQPYYFPPAAEPYHEQVSSWQRDFQKHLGKHHAAHFDQKGWLYFSKEIFDLLYPSYGDTYPTFNGAIGMTYEQGGSGRAGLGVIKLNGDTLLLKDRIEHHVVTGISTIEIALEYRKKLIGEFQDFYAKNEQQKSSAYILDGTSSNLPGLLKLLDQHEIIYSIVGENSNEEVKGWDYFSDNTVSRKLLKNDVIITTQQPKGTLVNVLFEQKTQLSDSLTYDITAWSLPYAYGVSCIKGSKITAPPAIKLPRKSFDLNLQAEPYAIAIPWDNLSSVRVLNALLDSGVKVSMTQKEITTKEGVLKRGTLLVLKADNARTTLANVVNQVLNIHQIQGIPLYSGWAEQGVDLGSESIKNIAKPRIGLLYNDESSSLSVGEIWHFLDVQLGVEHQLLRNGDSDPSVISELDVILIPEGYRNDYRENLKQWIKDGGICIVMGSGAAHFMDSDFGMNLSEDQFPNITGELGNFGNVERSNLSESIIGAIYRCNVDVSHPLAFGYPEMYHTLRLAAEVYPFKGEVVQKIQAKNAWVTGFAGYKVKHKQEGAITVGSANLGDGKIIYFFDNPLFRAFWENGKLQVANAIYFMR